MVKYNTAKIIFFTTIPHFIYVSVKQSLISSINRLIFLLGLFTPLFKCVWLLGISIGLISILFIRVFVILFFVAIAIIWRCASAVIDHSGLTHFLPRILDVLYQLQCYFHGRKHW